MKKYSILTFFFCYSSYATDALGDLVKKLSTVDEVNCEEMTSEELAQNCAREVCGPPGSKTSRLTAKNFNKFMTPQQLQELEKIDADVSQIVKKEKQNLQEVINELKKRKADPKFKSTADWDEYDYSNASGFLWKYISWEVDGAKPLKQRSLMIIKDSAPDYLLPGIEEIAKNFNSYLYNDPVYAYKSGIMNVNELKTAIVEKANKLKDHLASKNRQASFDLNKFTRDLTRLNNPDQIENHFKSIEDLGNKNGIDLVSRDLYCQKQCQKSIKEFVSKANIDTIINNLTTSLESIDEKDKIAECKASYISINQQNNLTKNFDKIWPAVKEGYKKNVLPRFSSHSRKVMDDYLDNGLHFYFENPTNESFPDLKEMLKEDKNKIKPQKKNNSNLLSDLTADYYDSDINLFWGDKSICERYVVPSRIWDSFLAKENIGPNLAAQRPFYNHRKDNISVSPFTCEHHREGSGILAHELGHAISHLMNKKDMSSSSLQDYRKIRSCASDQWDIKGPSKYNDHPGDKQFTEEDSADILSYMAINDGQSLYACGFLGSDIMESEYTSLDTEPWEGATHTPSLIRLMREMTYKKSKIPKSCDVLISRHQDKMGDKKCF